MKKDINDVTSKEEVIRQKNLIASCFGRTTEGFPNSTISSSFMTYKGNKENLKDENCYKQISVRHLRNAEFYMEVHGEFIQIDFKFKSAIDPELRALWTQLENYGKCLNDMNDASNPNEEIPMLVFNIVPNDLADGQYLSFLNPFFWVLQPDKLGSKDFSSIRLFAMAESFVINDIPEEVNVNRITADVERRNSNQYVTR